MRRPRFRTVIVTLVGATVVTVGAAQLHHSIGDSHFGALSPICRVSTNEPLVALTFDDGPDPAYTPTVLRLLHSAGARATFFLIGAHAAAYPGLVGSEVAAGMQIGDHTWSHPYLTSLTTSAATDEERRGAAAISGAAAGSDQLFRAPYGLISPTELRAVAADGLTAVHWSVALDRWTNDADPAAAAASLATTIGPGDILLAHDARDGGITRDFAMRILANLIPLLQQRGLHLVTVDELLRSGTPVRATPRPWFWQSGFSCPEG